MSRSSATGVTGEPVALSAAEQVLLVCLGQVLAHGGIHRGLLGWPGECGLPRMRSRLDRAHLSTVQSSARRVFRIPQAVVQRLYGSRSPARSASAAAWTRPETPSLRRIFVTCTPAVRWLMKSSAPIWVLVRPLLTRRSTASSRGVSPYRALTPAGGELLAVTTSRGCNTILARSASARTW